MRVRYVVHTHITGKCIGMNGFVQFEDDAGNIMPSPLMQGFSNAVVDTENEAVRGALIKLGWTPP